MPRVDLKLLTDVDMYHFVENSIRGGISMISTRHAQANSPSFPDMYDSSLLNQNLINLDEKNLYGWAMSQSLPTHGFRILQQDKISTLKLLALESLVIDHSMYSSTQQAVFPESAPQRKLTPNLRVKVKYVVYYRNLKLYLQLGLAVTKVHRVLAFKQSPWLKAYIEFKTRQCSLAGDSFLKEFFKLMNNSVFGKTQQNLRNHVHLELITDTHILCKLVAKPSFYGGNPITDCLTVVQYKVVTLTLNRPIYVGFSVFKLSKLHMYDFHSMCVKYLRANQLQLLFMDTDSLAYAVQADDIYRDMVDDDASRYDFSEYPLDHARICWTASKMICLSLYG